MFDAANLFDPFRNAFICSEGCDIEVVDNNPDEDKGAFTHTTSNPARRED